MNKFLTGILNIICAVNVVAVVAMIVTGYSYYLDPEIYPVLSTAGLFFPITAVVNILFFIFWYFVRKTYLIVPTLGFLICCVPIRTYCPLNVPLTPTEACFRVLSYNTLSFGGDSIKDSTNQVLQYIKAIDADIVCLQESGATSVPIEVIKTTLNAYPYITTGKVGNEDYCSLMTLSKYPLIKTEDIPMKSGKNAAVAFWLNMDDEKVCVINCHLESNQFSPDEKAQYISVLKSVRDGDFQSDTIKAESKRIVKKLANAAVPRSEQARTIAAFIQRHEGSPIIVCGDFNDNPLSYTHHTIAENLQDCYVRAGIGLGFSYNQKGFNVRIDNILCSSHFKPYTCDVDNEIMASDHYPILSYMKRK